MSNAIELVSDGEGLAIIGDAHDVEAFLQDTGLEQAPSRELELHKVRSGATSLGAAIQVGADIAENSGRWVKLTKESAKAVKQFGLTPTKTPGVSHAMIGKPGNVKQWLQITTKPAELLSNPLMLTSVATMLQQQALQQQMDEIVAYLERIEEEVKAVLRAQKRAVIADVNGAGVILEEALSTQAEVGRVSEVTWSKVQGTSQTLASTQMYVLSELGEIQRRLGKETDLGKLARSMKDAQQDLREWLAVLARTVQLQDASYVLELDRVLDASHEEVETHRQGLVRARSSRLERIDNYTDTLLAQLTEIVRKANAKVLFHPIDSPAAVEASRALADDLNLLRQRLGLEASDGTSHAKRWRAAAAEAIDDARESAKRTALAAKQFSEESFDRATEAFRAVDRDGDGEPDQPLVLEVAEQAGTAVRDAASRFGSALSSRFPRKRRAIEPEDASDESSL